MKASRGILQNLGAPCDLLINRDRDRKGFAATPTRCPWSATSEARRLFCPASCGCSHQRTGRSRSRRSPRTTPRRRAPAGASRTAPQTRSRCAAATLQGDRTRPPSLALTRRQPPRATPPAFSAPSVCHQKGRNQPKTGHSADLPRIELSLEVSRSGACATAAHSSYKQEVGYQVEAAGQPLSLTARSC